MVAERWRLRKEEERKEEAKIERIPFYGETDATNPKKPFTLKSYMLEAGKEKETIKLDKGHKVKLIAYALTGKACTVFYEYTVDITADTPEWRGIKTFVLPSEGSVTEEIKEPSVLESKDGKLGIRFRWLQATAAESYLSATIEIETPS